MGELRDLLASGRPSGWSSCRDGPYRTEDQVPVGAAEGVVTGGDVLRALHEPVALERPVPTRRRRAAVRERLGDIARLAGILPAIQAVAASHDGVYLVGGAVRDVLLGEQSLDLDLMVEGDAIAFARELARSSAARATPTRSSRLRS